MPVYATYRESMFGFEVPDRTFYPLPESLMSRRQLTLVLVTIASMVATACGTSPTAPRQDVPSGVSVGSG
jgi:hypothetical protein